MKNMKLITLGITLFSMTLTMAQDAEVIREVTALPPPEDALIEGQANAALAEQQAQLAATADRIAEVAKAHAGAQQRVMLAQAGGGMGGSGGGFGQTFGAATHQRSPRALVIPKDASDAKSLGEVEEDLGVMAHLLDKAVSSGDKAERAMGIKIFGKFPGGAAAQNLYIEGHGAIFMLNVNYPLVPPPAKEAEEVKEPVNNEWEEARRELARPGKSQPGENPFEMFEERFEERYGGWNVNLPMAEYAADKVDDLKKDLITALKNAANIRRLKSDETVTVVVTGADAGVVTKTVRSTGAKPGTSKSERVVVAKTSSGERARANDSAKLIIRARKADAEAFQNGKLDFDAFRKKVTVLVF